ncbi:hypothetical protein JD969_04905 [Planctomycetota bacterium]|nr:hypothetical protein JD969_04905 [Planctomycetota bacterium]
MKESKVMISDANRLGLDYEAEARSLPYGEPIWDVHTHVQSVASAETMLKAMDVYGVEKVWSMSNLEITAELKEIFGDRIEFIAVPNFSQKDEEGTFTTDWWKRIEKFAEIGTKICKFWAAPRGLDFDPMFAIDHPTRRTAMDIARDCGMMFMTHVGDPDTWFATHYKDASKYGTKADHLASLEKMLDEYSDVTWIAAHMAAHPEHLDILQGVLDRHSNLYIDTSATKWMIREWSKHPKELADFCARNEGRVLFGSDIVTNDDNVDFDLYASRYWALRTMWETEYDGPSPIVDPDLTLIEPEKGKKQTAKLLGAGIPNGELDFVYRNAAVDLLSPMYEW